MQALIDYLNRTITAEQWLVLAGSTLVILFMIAVALLLGFRQTETLDEARMGALAEAEGAQLEGALIARNGKSGVGRLSGGKVMVARVMADGISARITQADAAHVRLRGGRLKVRFADIGYPPLSMRVAKDGAPSWLAQLAQGQPK